MSALTEQFAEHLNERVHAYHRLFKQIPVKGEHFEELVFSSLRDVGTTNLHWNANSHSIGTDITANGVRYSLKTAKMKEGKDRFDYSSFRTTSFPSIEQKIEFLDQCHYDVLLCFLRSDTASGILYRLLEVSTPVKYQQLNWSEDKVNYTGVSDQDYKVVIRKSRSHQVLVYTNLKHASEVCRSLVPIK